MAVSQAAALGMDRRGPAPSTAGYVPLQEVVNQPYYDSQSIATGNTETTFYTQASTNLAQSNVIRPNSFPNPQSFDLYEFTWQPPSGIAEADFRALCQSGVLIFGLANSKTYLQIPLRFVPTSPSVDGFFTTNNERNLRIGSNQMQERFPVWVPEVQVHQVTGRRLFTGQRLPIHIPSEQNFNVSILFPGAVTLTTGPHRVFIVMHGPRYREVL